MREWGEIELQGIIGQWRVQVFLMGIFHVSDVLSIFNQIHVLGIIFEELFLCPTLSSTDSMLYYNASTTMRLIHQNE